MVFALLPAPSRVVYPSRRLPEILGDWWTGLDCTTREAGLYPDIAARASGMSIIKDQALHDRWNFVSLHLPGYPPIIDPSPDIDSRASTAPSPRNHELEQGWHECRRAASPLPESLALR
jgi:hypothetical protein